MRTAGRVIKNSTIVFVGQMLRKVINLAIAITLAFYLKVDGYSRYKFLTVYLGMLSVFCEFGINPILERELARNKDRRGTALGSAFLLRLILAFAAILGSLLFLYSPAFASFFPHTPLWVRHLLALGSCKLIFEFAISFESLFRAELFNEYPILAGLCNSSIFLLGLLLIMFLKGNLFHITILWILLTASHGVALFFLARKYFSLNFGFNYAMMKNIFMSMVPLGLAALAIRTYQWVDIFMLESMEGGKAVGLYGFVVGIAHSANVLPSCIMVSLYPLFCRYYKESSEKLGQLFSLALRYMLILALPIGIGGIFTARAVLELPILPDEFIPAYRSFIYLLWAEVFLFINLLLYQLMNAIDRERINLWVVGIMLGGNVLLNFKLIPLYSHEGAAIATMLTEGLGTCFEIIFIFYLLHKYITVSSLLKIIPGVIVLTIALATSTDWYVLTRIIWALILYLGMLLAFRAIDFQEAKMFFIQPTKMESKAKV